MEKVSGGIKGKILIVDDERDIGVLFGELMRDMGYEVLSAANGEQALTVIESYKPDLVVSDVHMPKMDGKELYKRVLQKSPAYSGRFVFITGSEIDAPLRKLFTDSRCELVVKPFDISVLSEIIERKIAGIRG